MIPTVGSVGEIVNTTSLETMNRPNRRLYVFLALLLVSTYTLLGSSSVRTLAVEPLSPVGHPGAAGFPAGSWRLTANLNFTSTSLDQTQWTPNWLVSDPTAISNGFQYLYDQNCFNPKLDNVSFRMLNLAVVQQGCTGQNGHVWPYQGSVVSTVHSMRMQFGYVEAKIDFPLLHCRKGDIKPKNPQCVQNHPAFWMYSGTPTSSSATTSEIDIAEGLQGDTCSLIHFTATTYVDHNVMHCAPPLEGWHVYGAWWSPTQVKFYTDGKLTYAVTTPTGFNKPMFLILDNSVPTEWTPSAPSTLGVAYIRTWTQQ